MRAVFRADASVAIGGGHVQRCLTLADAFADRGWRCSFAFREGTLETVPALAASGHALLPLSEPDDDEPALIGAGSIPQCDLLVVDHYQRGQEFESRCRSFASCIFALDDLPRRAHDADFLLDATPRSDDGAYRAVVPPSCSLLTGPRFALLRPQFAEMRAAALARRERGGVPRRLLVGMGMTDSNNATAQVLRGVAASRLPLTVDVVLGAAAPHLSAVRALIPELRLDATLHVDVTDMASLISAADIAIGASGQTSFERCCLGLPSLMAVTADNQRDFADALVAAGAVERLQSLDETDIASALTCLVQDHERLRAMSRRASALCDGEGAGRAVQAVCASIAAPRQRAVSV
jgi:UDP-2,4-diacetamido-2,4,6-trideoxy-beta-L-altropyranose hydrolase